MQDEQKSIEQQSEEVITPVEENISVSYIDQKFELMSEEINGKMLENSEETKLIIDKLTHGLNQLLSGMREELEAVKNIALEKEEKIRRYEEGYDQKIIKNFRNDILRILDFADSKMEEDSSGAVGEIHEDLEILIETMGLEKINLEVGHTYDGNKKVAKVKSTIITDDSKKDMMVEKVLKNGYFIQTTEDNIKMVRPTEIILYKYMEKNR